ncbi:MAG: phosphoribosyltransferase family protein [Bacillota bacterium]|nr:phosphoribosyltransferase family protein [Bacillota bacterium]
MKIAFYSMGTNKKIRWESFEVDDPVDCRNCDCCILQIENEDELTGEQIEKIRQISFDLCKMGKELHIITESDSFSEGYIHDVEGGKYDAKTIARHWLSQITLSPEADTVILVDCDRTLSVGADSTHIAFDYWKKDIAAFFHIYRDGFFSTYQAAKAADIAARENLFTDECISYVSGKIQLNSALIDDLKSQQRVQILPITAGNAKIWELVLHKAGLDVTVPDTGMLMSEAVKYYVCRMLQESGHIVMAIGDSPLDIPMMIQSNRAYVISNKGKRDYMERVLKKYRHIHCLSYCRYHYPDVHCATGIDPVTVIAPLVNSKEAELIGQSKSSAKLCGRQLRNVHGEIGGLLARKINEDFPDTEFYVVVILRSGLMLGLSIADHFDCPILFCSVDKEPYWISGMQEDEKLSDKTPILVDGVINTGETLGKVSRLPFSVTPVAVTGVLSCGSSLCCPGKVYAARLSSVYYGDSDARKPVIDTSDRLYNLFSEMDE